MFTKNATEAINLVAHSYGRHRLPAGDAVLLTEMEHHANLVPWLMLREETGVELRYLPVADDGTLVLDDLDRLLDGVGLVSVTAMSNVLGTLNPIRRLADAAHAVGAVMLVDGSQYVPHLPTDVADLGCDLLAFTGHKMCGPTGIGVLWGREELLDSMPAFLGGGEMIRDVRLDGWTPNELPWKFEAGTPPIAEAVGLGAAVDYLAGLGMDAVRAHEVALTAYALRHAWASATATTSRIFGPADPEGRGGVLSFAYKDIHPHDLSQVLDETGVCIRAGHHCAKPLMRRMGVNATARASFYVYNDESDVDALSEALLSASNFFATSPRPPDVARRPVPRDHPRPLPQPAEPGRPAQPARPAGRGLQPAVRRRGRALRRHGRPTTTGPTGWPTSRSRARAAPSASRRRR